MASPQLYNPLHILQGINAFVPVLNRIPLLLSSEEIQNLQDSKHWMDHETGEPTSQVSHSQANLSNLIAKDNSAQLFLRRAVAKFIFILLSEMKIND